MVGHWISLPTGLVESPSLKGVQEESGSDTGGCGLGVTVTVLGGQLRLMILKYLPALMIL